MKFIRMPINRIIMKRTITQLELLVFYLTLLELVYQLLYHILTGNQLRARSMLHDKHNVPTI